MQDFLAQTRVIGGSCPSLDEKNWICWVGMYVYELHSGEDVIGMSFQGADEELLRQALQILQDRGKCTVFKGDTSEEDGIKFF
jgi:hypothetical protein